MKIRLKFVTKMWSGWPNSQEHLPAPQEKVFELSKGDIVGAKDLFKIPASVEVVDFSDKEIKIMTNGLVELKPGGTINLLKENRGLNHLVEIGQTIELVTQSMDVGDIISITPLEIVNE